MPIVKPYQYADTPIFRGMLYEREGRFPGTPEGEEPPEEPQGAVEAPDDPSDDDGGKVLSIPLGKALVPVKPVENSA